MASQATYELASETLGVLPIINHFLARSRIETVLRRHIDDEGPTGPDTSTCLGVLLRNIILDRGPVYSINGWGSPFRPDLIGLKPDEIGRLNDDRIGRALDSLFDADRASMMTETVVYAIKEFKLGLDQFHNDSTTLSL